MKALSTAVVCVCMSAALLRLSAQSASILTNSPSQDVSAAGTEANLDSLQKEAAEHPDQVEGWWKLGTTAYDANRFNVAVSSLKRVVQLQPQTGIAWDLLGLSQFELKQFADARKSLEHAADLAPVDDPEVEAVAAYHLGLLRIRDGDFTGAEEILQRNFGKSQNAQAQLAMGLAALHVALLPAEIDPSREALLLQVGNVSARGESGLADFGSLVAANDTVPMLHWAYGEALQKTGHMDAAIQQFRDELKLTPQSPTPWKALSLAERNQGKLHEAEFDAANALKFEKQKSDYEDRSKRWFAARTSGFGEAERADGMQAYASGQFATATKNLSAWAASHPSAGTAWAVLGLSEYELRDYDNARVHLERGISLGVQADPHAVATARYTLGLLMLRAGDFDRAATELTAAQALGADQSEIEQALGCVLLRRTAVPTVGDDPLLTGAGRIEVMLLASRYDEAFPAFRALLAKYPTQPNLHWAFGTALLALSEYDEAAEQMRAEQKLSPDSDLAYSGLASVALRQHKPSEAIASAQRAISLSPESAEAHYLLGRALLESGDSVAKSVKELQRALQLNPNSPEIHYTLAKAYARDSKPELAEKERAAFSRLNELRQAENSGKTGETYAGPRQAEVLTGATAKK